MSSFEQLICFLTELKATRTYYRLCTGDNSIMVEAMNPGERWEIEFFAHGGVQLTQFRSTGNIYCEKESYEHLFKGDENR